MKYRKRINGNTRSDNESFRSISRPPMSEARSTTRIKQRDYTIPVRLNQLLPPSSIIREQRTRADREGRSRGDDSVCPASYCINTQSQHCVSTNQRHAQQQPLIKMTTSTATKTTITQISVKLTLMVIAIASLILITSMSKFCYCDTQKISNKNKNIFHNAQAAIEAQHASQIHRNNRHQASSSEGTNSISHKENLLSYLTDSIERQHFTNSLKPVRAFVHQRPSKFDSGDDLSEAGSDTSNTFVSRARPFVSIRNNATNRHSSVDKVDESLRQIMMMHEQSAVMSSHNGPKLNQEGSTTTSSSGLAGKLRELSRGPARVASSLINPNKMMSNVLSYISPLVSSKIPMINTHQLPDLKSLILPQNSTSNYGSKLNFHSFVGRSNNQAYSRPAFVTVLPQASFLAKPDHFEKAGQREYSSTPADLINNFGDAVLKSALIKPNISPKDLTAEASDSLNQQLMGSNSATSGISTATKKATLDSQNLFKEGSKQYSDDSGNSLTVTAASKHFLRPLVGSSSGSSWLRDSANKVAQSYIQDSFRGLLTLSQLPILQNGPISTAPSVLEKGSKLKDSKKLGGASGSTNSQSSHTSSSSAPSLLLSQNQRKRALDELYRYAYILGTGVRRKRDPLTALGSSPTSALTNQKGVFSQRSRNQFTATNSANNKQLLDYARGLKSILSTGAKPRGVMWDMATDPSLAVTVFHLLERASVALPLGK